MCGAGADPIWSEPESAPGPRNSGAGAAQKSGGSATLDALYKQCCGAGARAGGGKIILGPGAGAGAENKF